MVGASSFSKPAPFDRLRAHELTTAGVSMTHFPSSRAFGWGGGHSRDELVSGGGRVGGEDPCGVRRLLTKTRRQTTEQLAPAEDVENQDRQRGQHHSG